MQDPQNSAFRHTSYLIRRKVLKVFGGAFHIYDEQGTLQFYSKQKAFKLKEDIRVFADEAMSTELLLIKARNIIDFAATYDVFDPREGNLHVGCIKRKGLKSILADEWLLLTPSGEQIGTIKEDSVILALLRRLVVGWLLPQEYLGRIGASLVCRFRRNFNPFVSKVTLDFTPDVGGLLDRRLGIAAAILLVAIEGKDQ